MASSRKPTFLTFLVAAMLTVTASGCLRHKVHAGPPVLVPLEPPAPVVTSEPAKSPAPIPAPTTPAPKNPEPATPPSALTPKPDTLKRPVVAQPEPDRPPAPQISPQMSPSDQAELAKQTQQFTTDAQNNLHRADGRNLTPSQRDMADKIRGFLAQAQDAIRTSDWARAKNLAQKADLLSLELVKTL